MDLEVLMVLARPVVENSVDVDGSAPKAKAARGPIFVELEVQMIHGGLSDGDGHGEMVTLDWSTRIPNDSEAASENARRGRSSMRSWRSRPLTYSRSRS
jgi:hypothetical protein